MRKESTRNIKTFDVSFAGFTNLTVDCEYKKTRNGFKHEATLIDNGSVVCKAAEHWVNRTWESFEYERAIRKVLAKSKRWNDEQLQSIMGQLLTAERSRINKQFGFIGAIAKIGEVLTDNKSDANKWKARMLKAGLPLTFPSDWDSLSEDEKEKRLDKVIALTKEAP